MKLGFIGCGKMATALAKGVLKAGVTTPELVTVSDVVPAAAEQLASATGARVVVKNADVAAASDVLILAVKPADALTALQAIGTAGDGKLLISIVAGLTVSSLESVGAGLRIIRAMPNTPALIMQGATGLARGSKATDADIALASQIFSSVGVAVTVKEALLDAVTGLSGSGPAYVYTIVEALADGGVLMGLSRELALQLAAQTVAGSAQMVLQSSTHPAALRDQVTSPGGTTIAGVEALEKGGLRAALISAVRAATERAQELGRAK